MNITLQHLAIICLTIFLLFAGSLYTFFMVKALNKGVIKIITPNEKTYRLSFLVLIITATSYIALGLGNDINEGVLALLGSIAGYLLGGVRSKEPLESRQATDNNSTNN